MKRANREEWAKRVELWRRSGRAGGAFAAELGVKESTLRHWKWKLDQWKGQPRRPMAGAAFVQVAPVEIPVVEAGAERIEVVLLDGVRIRVPAQFEAATLRRVLDVLEAS